MTFGAHFYRMSQLPRIKAKIHFCTDPVTNPDRKELTGMLRSGCCPTFSSNQLVIQQMTDTETLVDSNRDFLRQAQRLILSITDESYVHSDGTIHQVVCWRSLAARN